MVESRKLRNYENSFVVYRDGIFCGQSKNKMDLYLTALGLYGFEREIAVFQVPKESDEPNFDKAMGQFLIPSKYLPKYLASKGL